MDPEILFTERQHFKQVWIWALLLSLDGLFLYGVIRQVILNREFSDRPMSDVGLLITLCLVLFLTFLFYAFHLDTYIKKDGIYVRFFPFHLKHRRFAWEQISKSYVREYKPIREYGGWGLRLGLFGNGEALSVAGNKGIQLVFANGSKLLIGTQKPDEARAALKLLGHLKKEH